MNRFSASEAALEGFRLTRERPGAILAWAAINFVCILGVAMLMLASLDPEFIDMARRGALTPEEMERAATLLGESLPAFLLVVMLLAILMSVLTAGIYRIVLRPGERGFAFLRLGRDELRLTAVNLVLYAVGLVCLFAMIVAARTPAGVLGLLLVLALTVWLGVRLSMVTPMTFAQRRIAVRPAWALTRGRFWPLFGMIVLAVIFYVMVWLLLAIIGTAILTLMGGQEAMSNPGALGPLALIGFVAYGALQVILQVLQIVMIYAPFAVAYQQLGGDPPGEPEGS